jgi:ATP adenylyltransferase
MRQLWAPWRMEYVAAGQSDQGCVLCAIAAGDDAESRLVVDRGELVFTVLNLYPYSSGHLMVVPIRHVPAISDLTVEEGGAVFAATQRAVHALDAAMSPQGFNLGANQGRAAGAGIDDHFHLHVVPRWNGDTNFMPVLADAKVIPEHMDRTAERLRAAFADVGESPAK